MGWIAKIMLRDPPQELCTFLQRALKRLSDNVHGRTLGVHGGCTKSTGHSSGSSCRYLWTCQGLPIWCRWVAARWVVAASMPLPDGNSYRRPGCAKAGLSGQGVAKGTYCIHRRQERRVQEVQMRWIEDILPISASNESALNFGLNIFARIVKFHV